MKKSKGQIIRVKIRLPKRVDILPKVERVGDHFKHRYVIDRKLPRRFRKSLLLHEIIEDNLQESGMSYKRAHKIADKIERRVFPLKRSDWKDYDDFVCRIHEANKLRGML